MFIRISADKFKDAVLDMLNNSQNVTVNFKLSGNVLYLQTMNGLIDERLIIVDSVEEYKDNDITVNLDQTLNLINEREILTLKVQKELFELVQKNLTYTAIAIPENRIDNDSLSITETAMLFNKHEFQRVVQEAKALDEVARILASNTASIQVCEGKAYIYYSNTVFITKLNLSNCSIASGLARELVSILNRSKVCYYDKDEKEGVFKIKITDNEAVTLPIQHINYEMVYGVNKVLQDMKTVTNINMKLYNEYMQIICKAYKRLQVTLSVCENGLGLFIDNSKTQFSIGYSSTPLFTITISTAQLMAIQKLFGDCSNVQIERGDNCICLKEQNSEKTLLIAGMLF